MNTEFDLIPEDGWRKKIYETFYLSHTKAGKIFDILLLVLILTNTALLMVETNPGINILAIDLCSRDMPNQVTNLKQKEASKQEKSTAFEDIIPGLEASFDLLKIKLDSEK